MVNIVSVQFLKQLNGRVAAVVTDIHVVFPLDTSEGNDILTAWMLFELKKHLLLSRASAFRVCGTEFGTRFKKMLSAFGSGKGVDIQLN